MRSSSSTSRAARAWIVIVGFALLVVVVAACSASDAPGKQSGEGRAPADGGLLVRDDLDGRPIDRRVLGTNVPAWLGPDLLSNPAFIGLVRTSGVTLLRMPGGSWSNSYDWSACENSDDTRCYWTWAARPTDFANLMRATGLPGLWTVSINETAQSAAAAVAFFNGGVDDNRVIGVDRNGVDWGTVGIWARLRSTHGNALPVPVALWEVGNEVFGGRPDKGGAQCVSFGWEDVWTCDGTAYVHGDDRHDGYRAIRQAMTAVDPSIKVGAVGVADPSSWSDWGNEVIQAAGDELDFYTVHQYGFDTSPDDDAALARATELWPEVIRGARSALAADVPVAVTEYNLVASQSGDADRSMTRAVNALFIADTIGQLMTSGVTIANQWNVANGATDGGTDYGMVDAADLSTFPQFHAMALWSQTGDALLAVEGDGLDSMHVYPTRRDDGAIVIMLINLGDRQASLNLRLASSPVSTHGRLTTLRAADLTDEQLIASPPIVVRAESNGTLPLSLPAWSLNVLEVDRGE